MSATATVYKTEYSDDQLMACIMLRDHAAMRIVADRYARVAWRIAYRMLGDQGDAEDVAQESLLKLWNHADRWQDGGPGISAWLAKVATNQSLDMLRRRRFKGDEDMPDRVDATPLADAQIEESAVQRAVQQCIEKLPERQRAAVILTYYEETPNQPASDMLNMQLKAFESLLFRARVSLRNCIVSKGVSDRYASRKLQ
ncbi:MAG: sigma-70 family RNA polymerase sigma factor [Sphingorhabdus sp.]